MQATLPPFRLECGRILPEVSVAYQTWGTLNAARDNALVVCHALTGDPHVDRWWNPLLGPGRALDTDRYFVICANALGSCYGTTGPTTRNPETGAPYGADFPPCTIRDMVALQKALLDHLGIRGAAAAVGGSMGGMQVLEWAFYGDFVRALVPIAVGGRHTAWCIGWSEAQRQAVYADPAWRGGRYNPAERPRRGLAAARMTALLSYRSRDAFETRFGRRSIDRDGSPAGVFSVESYLRYQGQKLVDRFDANSYIRLTQAMDTHDVARGRGAYARALASIRQPTLVIGIDSDLLYPLSEQQELAAGIPHAELFVLHAPDGHDAFLIELETLNAIIRTWLQETIEPTPSKS